MPDIGPHCHELRVRDKNRDWRIIYRIDPRFILIGEVFSKTTRTTPDEVINNCKTRFAKADADFREAARAARRRRT
jgi:phage-related protein